MKSLTLAIFLLLTLATRASAQSADGDLSSAFSQLKANGAIPFAKALYPDEPENARQLISQLSPLIQMAGEFSTFELVSRRFLTKRVERLIVVIYFENFPVYLRIDSYENSKRRIFLPVKISRDAADILPFDLISASGK